MNSSLAPAHDGKRRAIGIVRVSNTRGREGERFVSPEEQLDRIRAVCERDGLVLAAVHEELDVSGGKALAQRPGLSAAVSAVEAGKANVVAAAYFDRLFRSLTTQAEVIDRVEQAGGQVLAIDVGQVTNGSAGQWLSGTMMGAVSEYYRRSIKERSAEGQTRAVARGAIPWANVPLGYLRRDDGTLAVDEAARKLVQRVFQMRAAGESISAIRAMLKAEGIDRSHRGVHLMLSNRIYLGELHFGKLVNPRACEAIIDRDLFARVQKMSLPRGRQAKSELLLARLGVLRCGSCGARLTAMTMPQQRGPDGGPYRIYRCASTNDCPKHVTIAAHVADDVVVKAVRSALADQEGRASAAEASRAAVSRLQAAQDALDAALRSFAATALQDEPAAVQRLADLRQARDNAQAEVDRVGPEQVQVVRADTDWELLTVDEQRALIRAVIDRAEVAPGGRGAGRISISLRQ